MATLFGSTGNNLDNSLLGANGDDTLSGEGGADLLNGGHGAGSMAGGADADRLPLLAPGNWRLAIGDCEQAHQARPGLPEQDLA